MIRKAALKDIRPIYDLLQEYGRRGQLLPRPLSGLYDHLRDFSVYVNDETDTVIGCGALQFCWEGLAEIRSLAVHPNFVKNKIGSKMIEWIIAEARAFLITHLFTLTYKPDFFKKFGFVVVDKSELPLKIWGECIGCVKFPDCDEIALLKKIDY